MKHKRKWRLLTACYVVGVLVYLLLCLFYLVRDTAARNAGQMEQQQLWLEDFTLESIIQLETEDGVQRFVSTDTDPQMMYQQEHSFQVGRFVFNAETNNKPSGSIVLYYKTKMGEDFTEQNKIWAKKDDQGNWYFDLRGKRVVALRLDPDSTGGVIWYVNRIVLNQTIPVEEYFIPDGMAVFALLFLPAFAAALLSEGLAIAAPYFARRRFDNQAKQTPARPK